VRVHKLVKSIDPVRVSVTELSRTAFRLRKVWLEVVKKGIRCYRLNAIPGLIEYIHRGYVQVIQEEECPIGKPFFIDTDSREKETSKHSFRYIFELLGAI